MEKFIDADTIRNILTYNDLIPLMEKALSKFSNNCVVQPVRSVLPVEKEGGFLGLMPALCEEDDVLATKLVTFFPHNLTRYKVPTHNAVIVVFCTKTGIPKAIMDGEVITTMRTAAVSAVATKYLAPAKPQKLAILGAGVQARSHFRALSNLFHFKEVYIWSRTFESAEKCAKEIEATACTACNTVQEAVKDADVIVTVTAAVTPVLKADWVKPGAHINAVGACRPDWSEIDPELMRSSVLYVDSREGALAESGDVILSKVSHSQSLSEKPLQPWVVAERDGKILTAHCDCMAGLGEACTHVGALLFAVEATVRIRETKTATAVKAYWLLPASKKGVQYAEISDINFTAAKTRKKKLDMQIHDLSSPKHIQPSPAHSFKRSDTPVPTAEEFSEFLGKLSECDSKPAILSLIEPFSDHYIPPALQPDFPPLLSELYKEECYAMEYNNLLEYCKEVEVSVSEHQIKAVEEATRAQSGSKLWFRFRAGRVTASRLKAVCKTKADSPSQSLIRSICYPEMTKFSSRATQWGCTHEKVAREQYIAVKRNEGHDNLEFGESGFVINKDLPFMGASPDGIVSCDCCGDGCFEIKCPYCVKDSKLSDIESKDFCLEISSDGTKKLKQTHNYYYQVQCQLFTCGKEYCDFVVWTKSDIHVETVEPDVDFWDQAAPTAAIFFERVLLPELAGKFFSRKKSVFSSCDNKILQKESDCNSAPTSEINESDSTVWCICKKPEEGKMIACHNENCKTEWFHFKCVGLKRAPNKSSVWYCPACKQQPQFSKKKMPPKIKV